MSLFAAPDEVWHEGSVWHRRDQVDLADRRWQGSGMIVRSATFHRLSTPSRQCRSLITFTACTPQAEPMPLVLNCVGLKRTGVTGGFCYPPRSATHEGKKVQSMLMGAVSEARQSELDPGD